jgi:uncharacterized protein (DUF952 family)
MNTEKELTYPHASFRIDIANPYEAVSKGDIVIVNLEETYARNNDLVLVDIDSLKEISRAERIGSEPLRLFPHHLIKRDSINDVIVGKVVNIQKNH